MNDADFITGAGWLSRARRILIITGAGISAESGLPTYRGVGGLYQQVDTEDGLSIEDVLSGDVFQFQPELTWKYLAQIERACRGAKPNAAHRAICELQRSREVWVLTQNVDSLHRDAGTRNLIEIHGNLHELICIRCRWQTRVRDYAGLAIPPVCPDCGTLVRPAVVLFGELLPQAAVQTLHHQLQQGFDCIVSIGTTARLPYVAAPVLQARARGTPTIEINPTVTELSSIVDLHLSTGASAGLAGLQRHLLP